MMPTWYKPWQYVTDSDCIKLGFFGLLKYLVGIITFLIISIALVVNLFKIWFTLLKAYISIIIAIILAPFWIIVGVLPGGGLGFAQWVRHMVSHLAAYPAAACMLILASILAQNSNANTPGGSVFLPPLIGNPNIADNMGIIAAFAVIMLTPDILNMVRDALKTPQGKYTGNITGRAKSGNPVGLLGAAGQYGYYMSGLTHGPVGGLINKVRARKDVNPEPGAANH
jgi:hypothetical protein